MPIYEISCRNCDFVGETIVIKSDDIIRCPSCGSDQTHKLISATSSLTGKSGQGFPGPSDTACCGQNPATAGCNGPGSCCGRTAPV